MRLWGTAVLILFLIPSRSLFCLSVRFDIYRSLESFGESEREKRLGHTEERGEGSGIDW
jgi:hypothetical protein